MTAVIHAVRSGTSEDVARLVHRGEEVNRHDINGYTALHSACERCKLNELNLLLEYNANVNHPTKVSFFFILLPCRPFLRNYVLNDDSDSLKDANL